MRRLQLWVRAYFGFSRMETNGFLLLIPLVFALLFSEPIYRALREPPAMTGIDRTDSLLAWIEARQQRPSTAPTKRFLAFSPDTIEVHELVAMGLNERVARRMIGYREKGGRFHALKDVAKIYGMDTAWLRDASHWMKFPTRKKIIVGAQPKRPTKDNINQADTIRLQDVYGVGPALARRIVNFRDRLGGYVTMEQLRDVYGLDSVVVERVKRQFEVKPGFTPRQLNLGEATAEEISRHPYINRRQAQAIVAYRLQHQGLDSLGQLLEIKLLDAAWLNRVRPYAVVH